jgi:hypothetical protein
VDDLGEGLRCRLDYLEKRKGKQVLCFTTKMLNPPVAQQTFGDRVAARVTVAIGHNLPEHAFTRQTAPDPVVQPVGGSFESFSIGISPADRIPTSLVAGISAAKCSA